MATVALAAGAPAANAGLLVESAPDCSPKPVSQPFAPWGDRANYELARVAHSSRGRSRGS